MRIKGHVSPSPEPTLPPRALVASGEEEASEADSLRTADADGIMLSTAEPVTVRTTTTTTDAQDTLPDAPGAEDEAPAAPVGDVADSDGEASETRSLVDAVVHPDRREGSFQDDGSDEGDWSGHAINDNDVDDGDNYHRYNNEDHDDDADEDDWTSEDTFALAAFGVCFGLTLCFVIVVCSIGLRRIKPSPAPLSGSARRANNRARKKR